MDLNLSILIRKLTQHHLTNIGYDLVCLRMMYSISGQFSELQMVLCASTSSSALGIVTKDEKDDSSSTSSETTSSDSDFTFPAPASTPTDFSSANSSALQLIVQDLSAAEVSGQSSP